jgi:hypothetical protein
MDHVLERAPPRKIEGCSDTEYSCAERNVSMVQRAIQVSASEYARSMEASAENDAHVEAAAPCEMNIADNEKPRWRRQHSTGNAQQFWERARTARVPDRRLGRECRRMSFHMQGSHAG